MNSIFKQIIRLIEKKEIKISDHGYNELANDGLYVKEIILGVKEAVVVEEYPQYQKGPCVLVLQKDSTGKPVHVVWGIPIGHDSPAVLVTAYRPNPQKWSKDFTRRKK